MYKLLHIWEGSKCYYLIVNHVWSGKKEVAALCTGNMSEVPVRTKKCQYAKD